MNKKEIKQQAKAKFVADKEAAQARKKEYASLTDEQKASVKIEESKVKKEAKKARKEEIKSLEGDEKKAAKKHDKYYKKLKTRPVRYTAWGVVGAAVLFVGVKAAPIVSDISELFDINLIQGTPEAIAAREAGEALAQTITDEGIVLLKNTDDLLPLVSGNVNVFGTQSQQMRLSGGGSGAADVSRAINFFDALNNVGIQYNQELYDVTKVAAEAEKQKDDEGGGGGVLAVLSAMFMPSVNDEAPIDYLTDDVMANAKEFSDTAIIVLTSDSVEASDATPEQLHVKGNKLELIEKVAGDFENVIIIVNAGNSLELGFVNEYPSIKAVLACGTPGATGPTSLANVISGKVNPSGRLTDTLVYDNTSAPAAQNFGDYKYDNVDKMATLEYEEGIYVGYRYYETRFAGDEYGYKENVLYPFGYGLSYTDFKWEVVNPNFSEDTISLTVNVTNTGDVAGKDVVEVYYQPPYTKGGIEKSATALVDFAKTSLLEPGQSESIVIDFPVRHMVSWDMENGNYVLEQGTYGISVNKNVHESVEFFSYNVPETRVYNESLTGYTYENQFEYANGGLNYLSRNDWEGTYPTAEDVNIHASDETLSAYDAYKNPAKMEGEEPTTGAENNIMFADLKGLEYDDPKWESFMDQFTFDELNRLYTHGGWKTVGVERLGVPGSVLLDGPAGINFFFGDVEAAAYPAALLLAQTWNEELVYEMGVSMGEEANVYGVHGIYAPAMNLHRTAYGGRNFEYYSEDPVISGRMGTAIIDGIQSKDVAVTMKHFIMNDQEINARAGLFLWSNEQAIRELYLKPFELAEEETDVTGVMSSFIHLGTVWNGANPNLLNNVLRGELGFEGFVSSDAVFWFMDPALAVRNGENLHLAALPTGQEKTVEAAYKEDPVGIMTGLRESVHTVLYTLLNDTKLVE